MANALQDQLLNIGLVDKKNAAQAKKVAENNLKLPVWQDGKIIFANSREILEKNNY
jgi:hypothetical protein